MNLINHPDEFKTGVRVVMKLLRGKDGGLAKPDHHAKKIITRSVEEWNDAVKELVASAEENERIYASVDERNVDKAIHEFKRRQLDADLYDEDSKYKFYVDVKNRFISCVMEPASRATKLFLIDCDTEEEFEEVEKKLKTLPTSFLHTYKTKSGQHVITKPFNPNLLGEHAALVKQNAMMLVGY